MDGLSFKVDESPRSSEQVANCKAHNAVLMNSDVHMNRYAPMHSVATISDLSRQTVPNLWIGDVNPASALGSTEPGLPFWTLMCPASDFILDTLLVGNLRHCST